MYMLCTNDAIATIVTKENSVAAGQQCKVLLKYEEDDWRNYDNLAKYVFREENRGFKRENGVKQI